MAIDALDSAADTAEIVKPLLGGGKRRPLGDHDTLTPTQCGLRVTAERARLLFWSHLDRLWCSNSKSAHFSVGIRARSASAVPFCMFRVTSRTSSLIIRNPLNTTLWCHHTI